MSSENFPELMGTTSVDDNSGNSLQFMTNKV